MSPLSRCEASFFCRYPFAAPWAGTASGRRRWRRPHGQDDLLPSTVSQLCGCLPSIDRKEVDAASETGGEEKHQEP